MKMVKEECGGNAINPGIKPGKAKKSLWKKIYVKHRIYACVGLLIAVLVFGTTGYIAHQMKQNNDHVRKAVTISTLEKIVNVSELNTFTAVYNGVAAVENAKKPEKVDYYVSYNAHVKAGLEFSNIQFVVDEKDKTITVKMPAIQINETSVDMGSLDFIFNNDKANKSAVTQEAYKACVADVKEEAAQEHVILELAQENAEKVITALIMPIVKAYDADYEIAVEWEM